jgi:hypothetical protein
MNISELINEIVSEWAYRVDDGMPDVQNEAHLKELSVVLKEMGLSHIKDTLIENLLTEKGKTPQEIEEADKNFTNPILNKKVTYKSDKGEDKEGIVGNLLRQPEGSPARTAAEKMLPPEGSPEREELNQELGGEGQAKKPEDGGDKKGGEEGGAPKEDPIKQAAPMFDPKVDPAMGARMDKEKEMNAKLADTSQSNDTSKKETEVEPNPLDAKFNPIDVKDVANEMPQADTDTFSGGSDIPDAIDPKELEQFNTDIKKVAQQVADAKANGEPAPNINLCDVTVPGTNLYCDDNLGIPRDEMPQFKGNAAPGSRAASMDADASGEVDTEPVFKEMLKEKGIKTLQTEVPADKLKATQKDLVGAKVVGMMGALEKDPNHPKITAPIYVSRDGYVIDGHHRWAAVVAYNAANPDKQIQMKTTVLDMDIKDAIPMANKFAEDMGIAAKKADANKEAPTSAPDGKINPIAKKAIEKIKDGVKNWSVDEKEFFNKKVHKGNSPQRRSFGEAFKDKMQGAWEAIKHGAQHEVHTFKEAGSGIKAWFGGEDVSESQKKAMISVAKKVAFAAAVGIAGGGLAHGAIAFTKHLMVEFVPHIVAETVIMGVGKAALFAGPMDTDTDKQMMKFMEAIADKLQNEEIPNEVMADAIESYNEKKSKPQMKEENIDLANELMLEMIYGFINEATYPKSDDGKYWVKAKSSGNVYTVITPKPAQHDIPNKREIGKAQADSNKGNEPAPMTGFRKNAKEKDLEPKNTTNTPTQQYNSESGIEDMEGPDGSSFEGYKDGKIKAPGTPAGAFNEVGGMKIAGYLRQNPNATDEELSKYLSEWANGGKITKKPKVSGGDKLTAAVRTGRAIYERCNEIAAEEGYDPTTTKISGYWGSEQSKANSIAQIQNIAKQNPNAKFNGYSVDEYIKIIEKNGAGENPTDVMLTIWDGKSDNVALFHVSNKIGSNNIQANSTVRKTYDRAVSIINNVFTDEAQKQAAMKSVDKRKANTLKLQKSQIEYQISFLGKFAAISKNEKALASLANDIYSEEGSIRRGDEIDKMFTSTGAIGKLCKKLEKPHPSCKLVDNAKATPSQKVKAMFDVYAANPNSAPSPVREIISRASTMKSDSGKPKYNTGYNAEVINEIYGKMNDEVEGMRKDLNKIQAGSGDRLLAKDFADRLHLTLAEGHNPGGIPANRFSLVMGNNEADIWYDKDGQAYQKIKNAYYKVNDDGNLDKSPTPLKQNQVNRGNISTIGDAKNFKHCLNTPKGKKIEEAINVKYGKINTKTGIQTAHIFDIDGKPVGIMTIRTKSGPGGDANDTIQFSKEMQNCMQKQEYLKKKNK